MSKVTLICGVEFEKQIADKVIKQEKADNLLVFNAGMGAGRARQVVDEAIKAGAGALVSYGVCGGLDPDLVAGEVIVPQTIISQNKSFQVDHHWRDRLVKTLSEQYEPRNVPLYTADKVITSVAEKSALFEKTTAGAVDMESAVIAGLAEQAGLPFIAVRVVHDTAGQHIPPAFAQIIDEHGKPNVIRLLKALIFHWPGIKVLKNLADGSAQARTNLDGLTRLALPNFNF